MNWFSVFLYLYAAGVSGAAAVVPPRDLGRPFFKLHAVLLLVLVTVATLAGRPLRAGTSFGTMRFLSEILAWALVADVVAVGFLVFSSRPLNSIAFLLPVITGAILALALALGAAPGSLWDGALLTAHLLTSGALLGSSLVAMLLGHAYLQNAGLSFDILTRLAKLFLGSAIAKTVVSAIYLAPEAGRWWPVLLDEFDGLLVLARVIAGLVGPVVLGFMVLSCARSRANQSATGILYAAVIFVLAGELISMHLTLGRGIRL